MKHPRWNEEEVRTLARLLDQQLSYKEVAEKLGRSVYGIKIAAYKKLSYTPLCLSCGKRIPERKGNRLRCVECAKKYNAERNNAFWKTPEGLAWIKKRNDEKRFGGLRHRVILRDKNKCVACGMTHEQHLLQFGCDLTIDHINGQGRGKEPDNRMGNLQTLCLVCHGKKDWQRRRKDWSMCAATLKEYWRKRNSIKTLLDEGYNSLEIAKEIGWDLSIVNNFISDIAIGE